MVSEAALTGLVASVIGVGLGVVAALGLRALLKAFGIVLPSAPLVFEARTPVVALVVGVGVTVLAAIIPARRAILIAPVAALVEADQDGGGGISRMRLLRGRLTLVGGGVAVLLGVINANVLLVGIGSYGLFMAALLLGPLAARPVANLIGRPLAALLGAPGRLGRRNATRNPRRTAQTAAALRIGLTLVSMIAVLGASLSASAKQSVDSAVRADYVVSGKIATPVQPTVTHLPGVAATTLVYRGQFEAGNKLETMGAVTLPGLNSTVNLNVVSGQQATALAKGELLIDTNTARANHLSVGSVVKVTFAQTGTTTMTIGGIFKPNPLVGSYIVGAPFFLAHFDHPLASALLVRGGTGGVTRFENTLKQTLRPFANLNIQSRRQFQNAQQASVNQLLGLVYVLLALAIVIALIGIVNTLMLSVFERTREIGLLRAVGMKRQQIRVMIRSEAVIVALFGAVTGIVIGTAMGAALASALRNSNVTTVSIPFVSLIAFLVLAALLGLLAAAWPARRAANLDVLAAIAAE